jgi:serine/threonine-protein kinase RsbW
MGANKQQLAVSVRCTSRREWIDAMQALAERVFALAGIADDQSYWPVLAVREAVMNAVIHGNKERTGTTVVVEYTVDAARIEICVQDQGEGFDPEILADPLSQENLLAEGGRGVYLIRQLMDEVNYSFPSSGGTRLSMVKELVGTSADDD